MSLLTICQDAADLLGITRPATIAGNTDATARTLGAIARDALEEIAGRHNWQELTQTASITLATGDQDYALHADFGRLIADTTYDRTDNEQQRIPVTAQEWACLYGSDLVNTSQNRRARIIGGQIVFYDTISAADNGKLIYYEFISNKLALNGVTPVSNLTVDAYTARIPERLIKLNVLWRYRKAKGLGWQADRDFFERELEKDTARSGGNTALNMGGPGYNDALGYGNLPDRGYG